MALPSKELMSDVLGMEVLPHRYDKDRKVLFYIQDLADCREINIYELAHKIKEWANDKDYWCISGYDDGYFCMVKDMPNNKWFYADTEFEAVVKAGEWVLKKIKGKDDNQR